MLRALLAACALALAVPSLAAARPAPVTWCGHDEVSANRVPDVQVGNQVHVIYATPSDGPDNFFAMASGIATDAAWIDQWWQTQDGARTPRFDFYPFPDCSSQFGGLDIGFVRLPDPSSVYLATDTPGSRLETDLASETSFTTKTLVYYDGPVADRQVCGESPIAQELGGMFGIALVYLNSDCGLSPPGTGGSAAVATHELIHNLGALPIGAPNECTDPNKRRHPCDSAADVLYPDFSLGETLDVLLLDVNHDDYYAHSGSWWDVQDSTWLEHLPQFPLAVSTSGSGTVTVAMDGGASPPCDPGCTLPLDNGAHVALTAVPEAGFVLAAWTGACTGNALHCDVSMDAAKTVVATFMRAPQRVTVRVTGKGTVKSSPGGIACPSSCARSFTFGSTVTLVAKPARGWRFARWSGACTGGPRCVVRARAAVSARARFARR